MKKIQIGFIVEGLISFLFAILIFFTVRYENAMYLLTFPFDLIGNGLRLLSLNSTLGNIAALLIYLFLSLFPLIYLLVKKYKRGLRKPDIFLPIISLYIFYMLYEFINPGLMMNRIPIILADQLMIPMIKMSIVYLFYTLCVGYFITRMLDNLTLFNAKDKSFILCEKLRLILIIFAIIYTFVLGYFMTYQTILNFTSCFGKSNTLINCTFAILSYLSDGLPIVFSIITIYTAIQLLQAITTMHLQEGEILAASKLAVISKRTVIITVICDITMNALQFLFTKQLSNTNYSLRFSFLPLIIAFAAVILSGFFTETKELHDDNEMII